MPHAGKRFPNAGGPVALPPMRAKMRIAVLKKA